MISEQALKSPVVPNGLIAVTDTMPSVLDELQEEFAQEAEDPRLYKVLPARKERLIAEYRRLTLDKAKQAIAEESDPSMLIETVTGIFIKDKTHEKANKRGLVPLGAATGNPELDPLGFDKRLCNLLKIPVGTAVDVLLFLFEGNDLALSAQAAELGQWSIKTKAEAYQDFENGSQQITA
jgi:hypothetical protein